LRTRHRRCRRVTSRRFIRGWGGRRSGPKSCCGPRRVPRVTSSTACWGAAKFVPDSLRSTAKPRSLPLTIAHHPSPPSHQLPGAWITSLLARRPPSTSPPLLWRIRRHASPGRFHPPSTRAASSNPPANHRYKTVMAVRHRDPNLDYTGGDGANPRIRRLLSAWTPAGADRVVMASLVCGDICRSIPYGAIGKTGSMAVRRGSGRP